MRASASAASPSIELPCLLESPWSAYFQALSSRLGGDRELLEDSAIQRLVDLARGGDRVAGQRLYRQHVDRVFRTVRGMLPSDADAEDVTQDAMLNVLTSLHRYSPRAGTRFIAWVTAIAINTARRRFRRRRPELTATGELRELADGDKGPERDFEIAQRREALLQALAGLDQRERELLSLRYGAELSAREIGELVQLEAANVRKILERTRSRLRARIDAVLESRGASI
jgi:RNA polymerase sigma-70 factor (ECF subfamily)